MAIETTYTQARAEFARLLDRVGDDREVVLIQRRGHTPVALVAADELESLLDNAASFSPAGGTVELVLSRVAGGIRIEVNDRGPGVPPEHRERVFDRFFTFRPEESRGEHSGLGLAIVRAIATGHGGAVEVSDREGGGARFVVTLPSA